MVRFEQKTFDVERSRCVGRLYTPVPPASAPFPVVVMGHGFSGVQESLAPTARDFAEAGFAVFTFDYRGFGESGGSPRQVVDIPGQLADWRAAIGFVRSLEAVDINRMALWGTSLSGSHVIRVAAEDEAIAAVISQVPFAGFPRKAHGRSSRDTLMLLRSALKDRLRRMLGRPPVLIPVLGKPGDGAVITTDKADVIIVSLAGGVWRNEVGARVVLEMIFTPRPIRAAGRLRAPLLVCIADRDAQTPPGAALRLSEAAPRGEARVYECAHFDVYKDPIRNRIVAQQVAFLERTYGRVTEPMSSDLSMIDPDMHCYLADV